jgi:hypothetical protein
MKTSREQRREFGKVLIRTGAVKSPVQAMLVLLTLKDTAMRQHAVHACRLAIDGRLPANKARIAFMRAAAEAGVLVEDANSDKIFLAQ